nr:hypothetical protein Iba_chr12eCG13810 [Ipomoea batatas]
MFAGETLSEQSREEFLKLSSPEKCCRLSSEGTEAATSTAVAMLTSSAAPTAANAARRIRPSRDSLSGILLNRLQSGMSRRLVPLILTHFPSCT